MFSEFVILVLSTGRALITDKYTVVMLVHINAVSRKLYYNATFI